MYGYAKVPKCLGYFSRNWAAGTEPAGISEIVGALESKTLLSRHFSWYLFSISIRVSLFSVCKPACQPESLNRSRSLAFSIFKIFAVAPAAPSATAIAEFVRGYCSFEAFGPCKTLVSETILTGIIRDLIRCIPRNMRNSMVTPHEKNECFYISHESTRLVCGSVDPLVP